MMQVRIMRQTKEINLKEGGACSKTRTSKSRTERSGEMIHVLAEVERSISIVTGKRQADKKAIRW